MASGVHIAYRWIDGWVGGWMGGWMDGWAGGRTDGVCVRVCVCICAAAPLWTQIVLVSLLAIWTISQEQRGAAEDCATSSSPVKQFFVQAFILPFHLLPLLPRPAVMGDIRREQLLIQWKFSVWNPHVWR